MFALHGVYHTPSAVCIQAPLPSFGHPHFVGLVGPVPPLGTDGLGAWNSNYHVTSTSSTVVPCHHGIILFHLFHPTTSLLAPTQNFGHEDAGLPKGRRLGGRGGRLREEAGCDRASGASR